MKGNNMPFYSNIDTPEAIRDLQRHLRSTYDARLGSPMIPLDGVLGQATIDAIKNVQRRANLTPNGIVDYPTWQAIVEEFETYQFLTEAPASILPFPDIPGYEVALDEISDLVAIIQIMLAAISVDYNEIGDIAINGVFDSNTENAVRAFQVRNNLTPNGIVDRRTWNALARAYEKYRDTDT